MDKTNELITKLAVSARCSYEAEMTRKYPVEIDEFQKYMTRMMDKVAESAKKEAISEYKARQFVDFKGAFIFSPKSWLCIKYPDGFTVKNAFFVDRSIFKAVCSLLGRRYRQFRADNKTLNF